MEMATCFLSTLLCVYALTAHLVHAQDQSDFISIDCGTSQVAGYTDLTTGINYVSDEGFITTGVNRKISPELQTNIITQFMDVRSFPQGVRNCYHLTPRQIIGYKYLIRARFYYGNYDGKNQYPQFDLHIGPNLWATMKFNASLPVVTEELIHVPASNYTDVCLVDTGLGTPFISVLELRYLKNDTYVPQSGSLSLFSRSNFGSTTNKFIRFKNDLYDRIWWPFYWPQVPTLNTSLTVDITTDDYNLPNVVMQTAVVAPQNASEYLQIFWVPEDPTSQYYIYLHFAELEVLQANQTREFNITMNGNILYGPFSPTYLTANTIYTPSPKVAEKFVFSLNKTRASTLPPIINGMEIYIAKQLLQSETDQGDVDAITNIKSTYGVTRNWQGDPCAPQAYIWDGLNCSNDGYDPPRIISLNLSFSGLSGGISSYISNLQLIQILDLSNNSLTGSVPDFLSQLPRLRILNLSGNNLTGSIPEGLFERSKNGSLSLSVGANPNLCSSVSCQNNTNTNKKNSIVAPVAASVAAFLVLILVALAILWGLKWRKKQVEKVGKVAAESIKREELLESKSQFTYSEVLSMTNNFERILGKGGFGTVYHGFIDSTQVAVKMLSPSSVQGYKQFHAEVRLLMRIHHRNLTSLVGYCDEGENMGLIYEFMAEGNLEEHLSDKSPNVLSWEERLHIATDSAQGLEYLHSGCKPPIVHRDVKCTNILLNEKFQAKVADFGLSRAFATDEGTHVSTVVAGTPGYLDPEYYVSNRLNEKSDVFSFGVVLFEIITGRRAITTHHEKIHVSKWVSDMLATKGDVRDIVDPRLRGDYDVNSVWKAIEVAMACVSPTAIRRPTMSYVVIELKECLATETARKESHTSESKDSIEMVSLSLDTELSRPLAR